MSKFLENYSKLIDSADLYLGPLNALTQNSEDELLQNISTISKTINLTLKIPFVATYLIKTKDVETITYLIKRELISGFVPYGGFIDIGRHYQNKYEEYNKKK